MTISRRLPLLIVCMLVAAFAGLVLLLARSTEKELGGYFQREVSYKADKFKEMILKRSDQALKATAWIESSNRLTDALQRKDRLTALALGKQAMESFGLDYFVITDTQGIVFARAHEPDKLGDSISNQINVKKALAGERSVELEEGSLVKYSIRAGTPLRKPDGRIVGAISLGFVLSSDTFVDEMQSLFSCDVSIFKGNERIATTIRQNGKRIEGTKLEDPEIEQTVLKEGKNYIGTASILGSPYIVDYQPLLGADGIPSGMLFIGQNMSVIGSLTMNLVKFDAAALFVILIAVSTTIPRSIKHTLSPLVRISGQLAERGNDLNLRFDDARKDEAGAISRSLNAYFDRLRGLILELKRIGESGGRIGETLAESSTEVSATVEEISATMDSIAIRIQEQGTTVDDADRAVGDIDGRIDRMAKRIEEQSVAISQSSSAIEELIGSISNLSSVTKEKRRLSAELVALAQDGDRDMSETLASVKNVEESVQEITDLVALIKSVADQTSLLAMNAAIEAAHAGQYGLGFAVVAQEIRKLSEETERQVLGIKSTIEHVGENIDSVGKSSERTGNSMASIIAGIKNIDGAMDETSQGLSEMSAGTGQISQSLESRISTSREIGEAGNAIKERSIAIRVSIGTIADRSRETISGTHETSLALNEIMKAMQGLSSKGAENAENIARLEDEIGRFKTD